MLELNKIYCGDCQTVTPDIYSDSVDCIVTDPPYQLSSPNIKNATKGFMGKSWDICPSVEIWRECLRVLKPGAFAFVMCIPRQDCLARMICRLEDAGFNICFSSIYWTYASGFPKAASLSKQADKRAGVERKVIGIDKVAAAKANKTKFNQCTAITPGKVGVNTQEFSAHTGEITEAVTVQAKALDGAYSGFQPKPAVEIVIVAMRPLEEKTYLDQALKNGHGCTWLDDARIPYEVSNKPKGGYGGMDIGIGKPNTHQEYRKEGNANSKGRFPANVLCENNVLNDGVERKSGGRKGERNITWWDSLTNTNNPPSIVTSCTKDEGSFSRYFSLDAWFAERIKLLPKEAQKTFPFLVIPKASKSEKNRGCEDIEDKKGNNNLMASKEVMRGHPEKGKPVWSENKEPLKVKNNHPTCKSIKLMSWLITLASREGDIVLDPFCGSGTTAIAAKMLGRQYIGIEKEGEYCEIARKRIAAVPMRLNSYTVL